MSYNGTVRCGYCGNQGHNRRSCPGLKTHAENNPGSHAAWEQERRKKSSSNRRCGWCNQTGHNARTCVEKKGASGKLAELVPHVEAQMSHILSLTGLGKGAIIKTIDYDGVTKYGTVLSGSYASGHRWQPPEEYVIPRESEPKLRVLWSNGQQDTVWCPGLNKEVLAAMFEKDSSLTQTRYWGYSSNMLVHPSNEPLKVAVTLDTAHRQCVEPLNEWITVVEESVKKCKDYKKRVENA